MKGRRIRPWWRRCHQQHHHCPATAVTAAVVLACLFGTKSHTSSPAFASSFMVVRRPAIIPAPMILPILPILPSQPFYHHRLLLCCRAMVAGSRDHDEEETFDNQDLRASMRDLLQVPIQTTAPHVHLADDPNDRPEQIWRDPLNGMSIYDLQAWVQQRSDAQPHNSMGATYEGDNATTTTTTTNTSIINNTDGVLLDADTYTDLPLQPDGSVDGRAMTESSAASSSNPATTASRRRRQQQQMQAVVRSLCQPAPLSPDAVVGAAAAVSEPDMMWQQLAAAVGRNRTTTAAVNSNRFNQTLHDQVFAHEQGYLAQSSIFRAALTNASQATAAREHRRAGSAVFRQRQQRAVHQLEQVLLASSSASWTNATVRNNNAAAAAPSCRDCGWRLSIDEQRHEAMFHGRCHVCHADYLLMTQQSTAGRRQRRRLPDAALPLTSAILSHTASAMMRPNTTRTGMSRLVRPPPSASLRTTVKRIPETTTASAQSSLPPSRDQDGMPQHERTASLLRPATASSPLLQRRADDPNNGRRRHVGPNDDESNMTPDARRQRNRPPNNASAAIAKVATNDAAVPSHVPVRSRTTSSRMDSSSSSAPHLGVTRPVESVGVQRATNPLEREVPAKNAPTKRSMATTTPAIARKTNVGSKTRASDPPASAGGHIVSLPPSQASTEPFLQEDMNAPDRLAAFQRRLARLQQSLDDNND